LAQNDPGGAERYARQALALNANLDDARLAMGRVALTRKDYKTAETEIRAFAAKYPSEWAGKYHLGMLHVAQGNLSQAESDFEGALKLNPAGSESLLALASLYQSQKRPEKGVERVRQAIAQSPNDAALYRVLARVYWSQNDKQKAEEA